MTDLAAPAAPDRLSEAIELHRRGQGLAAEPIYLELLAADAGHPDALHYLGLLRHQQGRDDEALDLIGRALQAVPRYTDAWNNLGNVHLRAGRFDEAETAYRAALECDAGHAGAWNNLGLTLRARGLYADSAEAYAKLASLAPDFAEAHYQLGLMLRHTSTLASVLDAFRRCIEIDPTHARAHYQYGYMLYITGHTAEAADVFRQWLTFDAANPVPRHMLAACSGEDVPARAADDYVKRTFDDFAESFDEVLLEKLDYHAPDLLAARLRADLGTAQATRIIVDAGCGTGLCGPWLKPYAQRLIGIDLSPGMLRKADARGDYDKLYEAELTRFLATYPAAFDVIVSADTLCYFGALEEFAAAARRSLKAGGWLGFTVERLDDDNPEPYRIRPHGRYAHRGDYVQATLAAAGFSGLSLEPGVLRMELSHPVQGWVVRARVGDA